MTTQDPDRNGNMASGAEIGPLEMPTADELFGPRPPEAPKPFPPVWQGDSIAVELADRECARLIANGLFDPPITEEEINKYALHFGIPRRQAELEIREGRRANT